MIDFCDDKNVGPETLYDIAIVGAGPAGLTAAIYALRDNKNVILFEKDEVGGQALYSSKIVNIPGFPEISGYDFIENVKEQLNSIESGDLRLVNEEVIDIIKKGDREFNIITGNNEYTAKSAIIATGSKYRTLNVKGEEELIGHGISFCSTCDAPFYKGKTVAVIGGGNSALTEAIELSRFARKVYILQNLEELTAQKGLIAKLGEIENIEVRTGIKVTGFSKYKVINEIGIDYSTYMASDYGWVDNCLVVSGVFLAIGMMPQNNCAKRVAFIKDGYINFSDGFVKAAGDCCDKLVRQIATACGDGAEAAVELCRLLNTLENI